MTPKNLLLLLAVLPAIFVGCDKASDKSTAGTADPAKEMEAKPFHGEVYHSLDGSKTLTIISPSECEFQNDGTILLCQYTKQSDALRVVLSKTGSTVVVYFNSNQQGLVGKDGVVLFAPQPYKEALDTKREHDSKLSALYEESRRVSEPIFKAATYEYTMSGEIKKVSGSIEVQQCFLVLYDLDNDGKRKSAPKQAIWYDYIDRINVNSYVIFLYGKGAYDGLAFASETEAETVAKRLSESVNKWKERYQSGVNEAEANIRKR